MILIFLNITLRTKSEFSLFSIALVSLAALSALITFIFFRINLAKRVADTKKSISKFKFEDSAWDYNDICERVKIVYFATLKSLAAGDISFSKEYISEEFMSQFQEKVSAIRYNKIDADKIKLKEIKAVSVEDDNSIWFYVNGTSSNCNVDLFIDGQLPKKHRAAKQNGEYWQFVFRNNGWKLNNILYDKVPKG